LHESVLLYEVISGLQLQPGHVVLDGTVGSGGHSEAILEAIGLTGLLIGIDQDKSALERTRKRLERFKSQLILEHFNFRNLDQALKEFKISAVDAVLLDIGVSKEQLTNGARGFSFRSDGPLDMRMDPSSSGKTASDLIQMLTEEDLAEIFHKYGEERHARRFARLIAAERKEAPIRTTRALAQLIEEHVPVRVRFGRLHPATRIFQALRIAVNGELDALKEGLEKSIAVLKPGGRLAVISFHSLEDRIVKHTFLAAKNEKKMEILTKKPIIPSEEESTRNPNSRSAKLRIAKKISGGFVKEKNQ